MSGTDVTFVKVPVLSEQITDTAPKVSTVFNDLHRTWLLFIIFAVMVNEAVSAIGKPSGMKATATVTISEHLLAKVHLCSLVME